MNTHSELLKNRITDLSIQCAAEDIEREQRRKEIEAKKEALHIQREEERANILLNCEAECVLFLESLNDEKIISNFTENTDPDTYVAQFCNSLYFTSFNKTVRKAITNDAYGMNLSKDIASIKTRYIENYVKNLIIPIRDQRIQQKKEAEELKQQTRRKELLDETNKKIMKYLQSTSSHTFTELTLDDWDKIYETEFLVRINTIWTNNKIDIREKRFVPCYTQSPKYISYYDEGKVPFFTKCPLCSAPTKFNYLHLRGNGGGWGNGGEISKKNYFTEVYCDKHYFYDSNTKKHYVGIQNGARIIPTRQDVGSWSYMCWSPQYHCTWAEWDPSDPDGKQTEAKKKQLEVEKIQKEITKLQNKLSSLQD